MISAKSLLRIFILLSILYLGCILFNSATPVFYLKPFLLLPLIVAVFISTNFKNKIILVGALVFSWIGDTLLLFVFKDAIYFMLGLVAFLTAHIFYIILFTKELKKGNGKIEFKKGLICTSHLFEHHVDGFNSAFRWLNHSRDYLCCSNQHHALHGLPVEFSLAQTCFHLSFNWSCFIYSFR